MRTSNPALSTRAFAGLRVAPHQRGMTIQGTVNKAGVLLVLVLLTAGWIWNQFFQSWDPAATTPWMMGGVIGGLVFAIITIFKKEWAPVTAPIYALLEGLVIGGLSAIMEAQYPGIVIQAVGLTFGTLFAMLSLYKMRIIRVTERFRTIVMAATGGIFLVYMVSFILGFFGMSVPFIHSSGPMGILFSVFVVGLAAFNLALDFDFIERGAAQGAPKFMEWYAAFGLMVTLIWLYIEILRLLAKLRRR